jgi:hypothetical protein
LIRGLWLRRRSGIGCRLSMRGVRLAEHRHQGNQKETRSPQVHSSSKLTNINLPPRSICDARRRPQFAGDNCPNRRLTECHDGWSRIGATCPTSIPLHFLMQIVV